MVVPEAGLCNPDNCSALAEDILQSLLSLVSVLCLLVCPEWC